MLEQSRMHELNERARKTMDEEVSAALASLDRKLAPFDELAKRIKTREALVLDRDHYVRKVKDLKENPKADMSKLTGNEAKLEAAMQRVHEATVSIQKAFGYYEAIGGRMVQPELEMLKKSQLAFFEAAYTTVRNVSVKDPRAISAEIERLGREGMERPTSAGYDVDSSSGGGGYGGYGGAGGSGHGGGSYGGGGGYGSYDRPSSANQPGSPSMSRPPAFAPDAGNGGGPAVSAAWMTNAGGGGGGGGGSGGAWWEKGNDTASNNLQSYGAPPVNPFGGGGASKPPPPPPSSQERAKALFNYAPQDSTEISLTAGEIVTIVEKHSSGWWTGEKNGQRGLFPSNYVQVM
ncbi:unnamed protein product [Phaeothamnion confervicola]